MELSFLAPHAALTGLGALAPLAAAYARAHTARRLRATLGLRDPSLLAHLPSLLALAAVAVLALAAAEPVLRVERTRFVRTDAEVLFAFDTSRSMLAAPSPGAPTRFARARVLSSELRSRLSDVPAGVASFSDHALPHLFPTPDRRAFAAVVARAVAAGRPGSLTPVGPVATDLAAIGSLASESYFSPRAKRRVAIVLTDGESVPFSPEGPAADLREARVQLIAVRFGSARERVYGRGDRPEAYRPDERSAREATRLVRAIGGEVYGEGARKEILDAAGRMLGHGTVVPAGREGRTLRLAPYVVLAAALPLSLLLVLASAARRRVPEPPTSFRPAGVLPPRTRQFGARSGDEGRARR
jgi:hypothetical protein